MFDLFSMLRIFGVETILEVCHNTRSPGWPITFKFEFLLKRTGTIQTSLLLSEKGAGIEI